MLPRGVQPTPPLAALVVVSRSWLDRRWPSPIGRKSGRWTSDKIFSRFQLPVRANRHRASEISGQAQDLHRRRVPVRHRHRRPAATRDPLGRNPRARVPGKGPEPIVSQDGEVVTRYTDFLFCWSTVPYNIAGTKQGTPTSSRGRELEAGPTGSLWTF